MLLHLHKNNYFSFIGKSIFLLLVLFEIRIPRSSQDHIQNLLYYVIGDRVIFAESPSAPGIPVVYRTSEERTTNPDRLNLDRRKLKICPILEGEEQLRLLNYQHNYISQIQHLSTLKRLIFLDLYDNHIEEITGLNSLRSLRVLMLGKNRIRKIENLEALTKLDVLDLHGNQIQIIENLSHLGELRVLNLAGNQIVHVDNISGMDALAELNLRRNQIQTVIDVDNLPNLQRLFLSINDISCFEDIQCLSESHCLSEISLDGNPLCQDQYYKQIILRNMQQLKQLDMKKVSEEERRIALVMARKEAEKRRESNKIAIMKEKRRIAISGVKRNWELKQGSHIAKTGSLIRTSPMPELFANHIGTLKNSDILFHNDKDDSESSGITNIDKGISEYAELDGDTFTLYGHQALENLERNWGIQAAGSITTIVFKFVDFEHVAKILHKIRTRFPATQTLVFSATNIHSLQQINALSHVRRLDNLTIDLDGNPVTKFTLWRMYTIFRLAHFSLKKINDIEVSPSDIVNAEKLFGPLSHITTSQLPQSRLLSLLGETRKKQLVALSEDKNRKGDKHAEKAQGEFVGRAGLTYQSADNLTKQQESEGKKKIAKNFINEFSKETIFNNKKQSEFQRLWSVIFYEMVQSALGDMSNMREYMKNCMEMCENS
ncbi:hypothetical protein LOTGIDRAFT_208342 [Lottia gigantea]|uniref:Leucine-rich repeat-containing protein 49 n=1 Tax=Lottia gigantea TaxID=225164 RepID=V4CS15_LOTGI|nr:hypothetical protein LOTGIDRAFT_208342 [Lottia gigantea]ESP05320.1 hypothetical protein LOTGIDRAFT_208342 [Lottia gigantea]